jgi:hypothetical protein
MSSYRLLADHYVSNQLLQAGSIVSDSGPGAVLPPGYIPTLACDPVDTGGLQAFFNAGPTPAMASAEHGALSTVFNGNRWSGIAVSAPVHYWKRAVVSGHNAWIVVGGESLGYWDADIKP